MVRFWNLFWKQQQQRLLITHGRDEGEDTYTISSMTLLLQQQGFCGGGGGSGGSCRRPRLLPRPASAVPLMVLLLAVIFVLPGVVVDAFQQQLQHHHHRSSYNNNYGDRKKKTSSSGCDRYHHRSSTQTTSTGLYSQSPSSSSEESPRTLKTKSGGDFLKENEKLINDFCIGTNEFWKKLVIKPVRDYVEIQILEEGQSLPKMDTLAKLIAPPQLPGISRPVWFTILGSVPTLLGWYGYYKFSVEEELYHYELQQGKPVTGCGGYGTLFPFVYGVIIGFPLSLLPIDGSNIVLEAAAFWILLGQVNLYRRVNELCLEELASEEGNGGELSKQLSNGQPPLYAWWAWLPPPLDVVCGLRQVHFLSEYWRLKRGEAYQRDVIAEELFPFISSPRFTLKEFFRTPSNWFWFTKEWEDFDFDILKD